MNEKAMLEEVKGKNGREYRLHYKGECFALVPSKLRKGVYYLADKSMAYAKVAGAKVFRVEGGTVRALK